MISRFNSLAVLLLAASLAACSTGSNTTPTDVGTSSMPQPANSLPPGDSVNAPVAPPTG